ncbi:MAG: contractile injection system protein, VgrG/Pvc8 family, partial [Myxococcota bacterium]|nr:contractile injection system protein, VgrG/Pvc8 family [Myxococcota bacterium]
MSLPRAASEIEYDFKIRAEADDGSETDVSFHVLQFHAREALSDLYRIELDLSFPDPELNLSALVGRNALLTMLHDEGERHFHGVVARIEVREEGPLSTCYRAVVVPRMWLLGHKRNSRIF